MPIIRERYRILHGEPSLRGLVVTEHSGVEEASQTTLYPWLRVGRPLRSDRSVWRVYDDRGHKAQQDGRFLQIKVPRDHRHWLACRAQARAFRHAWQRGDFVLQEHYRVSRAAGWIILILTVACLTLLARAMILKLGELSSAGADLPLPPEYHTLVVLGIVGFAIVVGVVAWLFLGIGYYLAAKPFVLSARFDNRGVQGTRRDGDLVSVAWTELRDVKQTGLYSRLRFRDGTTLWFGGMRPRTIVALRVIEGELKPDVRDRERGALARLALRGTLLAALCAAGTGWLVHQLNEILPSPLSWPLPVGCVFTVVLVLFLVPCLAPMIQRLTDRQRKRRRRQGRSERR